MKSPTFDPEKFSELVIYITQRCKDDPRFGAIKLNKILFYSDFAAYRQLGRPITGAEYQHLEEGPAPRQLTTTRRELISEGSVHLEFVPYFNYVQERLVPDREPVEAFTADELKIVDQVIDSLWNLNGKEISDRSHEELGWKLTTSGETIPYSAAWFSAEPLTADEEELGKRVAEKYGLRAA